MFIILIYRNFILQFPLFEGHMKNHKSFFAILIITLSISLSLFADTARYNVDMTIRQIAHEVGLKGRELAESLGLESSVDKDIALQKLGISQRQLEAALEKRSPRTSTSV
jgi:hypothetical protein